MVGKFYFVTWVNFIWYCKTVKFGSVSASECSDQISWKAAKSAYPINSFEEKGFSRKASASFHLLKIY